MDAGWCSVLAKGHLSAGCSGKQEQSGSLTLQFFFLPAALMCYTSLFCTDADVTLAVFPFRLPPNHPWSFQMVTEPRINSLHQSMTEYFIWADGQTLSVCRIIKHKKSRKSHQTSLSILIRVYFVVESCRSFRRHIRIIYSAQHGPC